MNNNPKHETISKILLDQIYTKQITNFNDDSNLKIKIINNLILDFNELLERLKPQLFEEIHVLDDFFNESYNNDKKYLENTIKGKL